MRIIDCLTCDQTEMILEEAGTFTFCDTTGEDTEARFFVRCPPKPGESEFGSTINSDRQSAANQQLEDMWAKLEAEGCQKIHFKNKMPDPFF